MHAATVRYSTLSPIRLLFSIALTLILTACGGGGSSDDSSENEISDDETITIVEPRDAGKRDARPGEIVKLQVDVESDDPDSIEYSWTQLSGPRVRVGDAGDRVSHFLMPRLPREIELTFIVNIHFPDGTTESEMHTVACDDDDSDNPPQMVTTDQYVVFLADKDINNRYDLYISWLDGSAIYRLNSPLVPGGNIERFELSPDGNWIAYLATQRTTDRYEWFVAKLDGSEAIRVSPDVPSGTYPDRFYWSPDSDHVGILTVSDDSLARELFVNTVDGNQMPWRVNGPLVQDGNVGDFKWSHDGEHLAYAADQNTDGIYEIFTVNVQGSNVQRVSPPVQVGEQFNFSLHWANNANRLAFSSYFYENGSNKIYAVDADGSNLEQLSHDLPSESYFLENTVIWSPDDSRIAYTGYYYFYNSSTFETTFSRNIFTAAADGSYSTQVSAVPIVSGEDRRFSRFSWAPDGSRILYSADQISNNVLELYTTGPEGENNTRVSGNLVTDGSVSSHIFAWSPDGQWIAYLANQHTAVTQELFVSDRTGSTNYRVSGDLITDGYIDGFSWSPDSDYLAYRADQRFDNQFELFTSTTDGSSNIRVSGHLANNGDVLGHKWSADGSRLVYRGNQFDAETAELFVAAPDGSIANSNISGSMTEGGDVLQFVTQ